MQNSVAVKPYSPVVFKRKAAWDGIRLEHIRLNAGELPKHRHAEHVVLVRPKRECLSVLKSQRIVVSRILGAVRP